MGPEFRDNVVYEKHDTMNHCSYAKLETLTQNWDLKVYIYFTIMSLRANGTIKNNNEYI